MNNPKPESNGGEKTTKPANRNAPWLIPPGVSKGNWDYVRAKQIASGYDEFLYSDPLTKVDWQIIDRYLPTVENMEPTEAPIVADFGCGTGRILSALLDCGYRGIGIDLSLPMLREFGNKTNENSSGKEEGVLRSAQHRSGKLILVNANLVELDGLKDDSVDHAVCMFSTLGMIKGAKHRAAFLAHVRRILKPGGQLFIHAHNVWYQLRHPGGVAWAFKNGWAHLTRKAEFGDRSANYRGLTNMFIHSFRKSEFKKTLQHNGFKKQNWFGVSPGNPNPIEKLPFASSLRLVGWIVVCE